MTTLLAGDIGGTKTLLSLYSSDALELLAQERYISADWVDLAPMVRHFLGQPQVRAHPRPGAACFAVAGPVHGGQAQLTNLPWKLAESRLALDCDLERVALVNDFAVLIYCLPHLTPPQRASVRPGEASAGEPVLVLGAGTGLGVAIGLPTYNGMLAMASEAAHGEFAPRSDAEWQLRQWLLDDLGLQRLSIERVVSGTGLGHVARWLMDQEQAASDHPLAVAGRRHQGEERRLPDRPAGGRGRGRRRRRSPGLQGPPPLARLLRRGDRRSGPGLPGPWRHLARRWYGG